jgi:EAL domain-containing protein (putative c-di-GMP-specific phosphodiesterase class I)
VAEILLTGGLRTLYQPIVELLSGDVVGYESLARGPVGSSFEFPIPMFEAARAENLLSELDRSCREVSLYGAIAAGAGPDVQLFINVEPGGLDDDGILGRMEEGQLAQLSVVVELTERALTDSPSHVLHVVQWLRERACRIALDDVGPDPRSLALMPFVAPDVIKLDASLLKDQTPATDVAAVVNAVQAEAERSGAVILAEGIETPEQATRAEAMGATLGQGWLFGAPGPLTRRPLVDLALHLPRIAAAQETRETPFQLIAHERRLRRGDKRLLSSLSRHLELQALGLRSEAVVLVTFQDRRYFTPATRGLYQRLSESAALVGALGVDLAVTAVPGVRCIDLQPDDPLCREWNLIIVSPHFAVAFAARDLDDDGPDAHRRFDYFVTYDRTLVTAAARSLLRRMIRTV